jgi:hypothetical protein
MKVCVTNKLHRPYVLTYVRNKDKPNYTGTIRLERGVNILDEKMAKQLQNHPLISQYFKKGIFEVTKANVAKKEPQTPAPESVEPEQEDKK